MTMWKLIEIEEDYVKKNGRVYWKWRFAGKKRWNYRQTALMDIPYVVLQPLKNMPHPLVHNPESIKKRINEIT